jgi:hypothetical protein
LRKLEILDGAEKPLDVRLAGTGFVDGNAVSRRILIPDDVLCKVFENGRVAATERLINSLDRCHMIHGIFSSLDAGEGQTYSFPILFSYVSAASSDAAEIVG